MIRSQSEIISRARELSSDDCACADVGILASFTAEILKPHIQVASDDLNFGLRPWFGPFNQFEQFLQPDSELWSTKPALVWLASRLEDFHRHLPDEIRGNRDRMSELLVHHNDRILRLCKMARENFDGPILVSNQSAFEFGRFDTFDANDTQGFVHQINAHNRNLSTQLGELVDTHVFDYDGCVNRFGADRWKDKRLWHLGRIPFSQQAQYALSTALCRAAISLVNVPAKCIVVDLDNTLWGGVIGDDGVENIVIGTDYPGSAFQDFQSALLGYQRQGFLLAIASKNEMSSVTEAFNHPEMLLKLDHFAAIEASWEPKSATIQRIAQSLNIGLDALVFLDDNPVERAEVASHLPEVKVVTMPTAAVDYVDALREVIELDRPRKLAEDLQRSEMYRSQIEREKRQSELSSVDDYLHDLKMEAEVGTLDPGTAARIEQLINKTNQFNLTTRRYTMEQIMRFADSQDSDVAWLKLSDRYGAMGLVCVAILKYRSNNVCEIDSFLMSCRVMGRNVEDAFLVFLKELASANGCDSLSGCYIPTLKNKPVQDFYVKAGFDRVGLTPESASTESATAENTDVDTPQKQPAERDRYEIVHNRLRVVWPTHIQRVSVNV